MISENILKFLVLFFRKVLSINYLLLIIVSIIFGFGVLLLYSAAGGQMDPWATKQSIRFIFAILL